MVYYMVDKVSTVSVGWDYFEVPIEEARRRMDYANPDEVGQRALRERFKTASAQGYPLNPESLPRRVRWQTARNDTPDILPDFVVSQRFRDFVEHFEPGVHQFVPTEVWRDKKGDRIEKYYWFVICQRLHSVNREHTTFAWIAPPDDPDAGHWTEHLFDRATSQMSRIPDARLVYDTQRIGSHHIWCDPHVLTFGHRLCSNAFAEAAEREKFVGLFFSPREEA